MSRREFPRRIRAQIVARAMDAQGRIVCEGCGLVLGHKRYEVDHTLAEVLVMDKARALTVDDGRLLGVDCCHRPKTANDIRMARKADRMRDKHLGVFPRSRRPLKGRGFPSPRQEGADRNG